MKGNQNPFYSVVCTRNFFVRLKLWLFLWCANLTLFFLCVRYLRALEMKAPWVLRYVVVSSIVAKHQSHSNISENYSSSIHSSRTRDIVKLVEQESYTYTLTDPVTLFIKNLYVQCDFAVAHKSLQQARQVLSQDFFISSARPMSQPVSGPLSSGAGVSGTSGTPLMEVFLQEARVAICETYCKIHHRINIDAILNQLQGNDPSTPQTERNIDTERWIVNLIRNIRLDAKIDAANNQVIISSTVRITFRSFLTYFFDQAPSVYQQLLDKTRSMTLKASVLASNNDLGLHYNLNPSSAVQDVEDDPRTHVAEDEVSITYLFYW